MSTTTRRTLRNWTAITGTLALLLGFSTVLPTSAAEAVAESDLVGSPEHFLIENVHAGGKILEIGNDSAQKTGQDGTPAAAAIFTRASTPTALAAQAVNAYPVKGRTATYVFTNQDSEVLVREGNDSEQFRYLALSDMSIDAAATDPYAQWAVVDAGGGSVYLQNVQRDGNGTVPALDMYNWMTADGSEIQTYDAGTATVQRWILRSLTPEVAGFSGRTEAGVVPVLPTTRTALYSWGTSVSISPISWTMPEQSAWDAEGTVTVTGTGAGYFGEEVTVTADYLVGSLGDAVDVAISGYAGITVKQLRMIAPARVERSISGSATTVSTPVVWDWSTVTEQMTATAGQFTVRASISTGFAANLVVTIADATRVNIARGTGIHFSALYGDGAALNDGNRDRAGFSDWRSGGATNRVNPNKVMYYFDEPRQITGAAVFDRGTDAKLNVGSVTVQYRTLTGGWVNLPATGIQWPYANTTPELNLTVENEPVLATGTRVVFTNKSNDTWMSLSEFEVYGPDSAAISAH